MILLLIIFSSLPLFAQEEITISLTGGQKIEMIKVSAGTFLMGTSEKQIEAWRKDNDRRRRAQPTSYVPMPISGEWPQHEVRISKSFYLGKREVSRGQWGAFMDRNNKNYAGDAPISSITWGEAQDFIEKLNEKMERSFRLPTEAEWEYAARAGATSWWWTGNDMQEAARIISDQSIPNPWGFIGMAGGVWEYVGDGERTYTSSPVINPMGPDPQGDQEIIVRGGDNGEYFSLTESPHWPHYCRSAYRMGWDIERKKKWVGFRLLLEENQPTHSRGNWSWGEIKKMEDFP